MKNQGFIISLLIIIIAIVGIGMGLYYYSKKDTRIPMVYSNSIDNVTVSSSTSVSKISVTYPKGGETFHPGQVMSIKWNAQGLTGNVYVDLINGNKMLTDSIDSVPVSQGFYNWTVFDVPKNYGWRNDGYQIVIDNHLTPDIQGKSAVFSIK